MTKRIAHIVFLVSLASCVEVFDPQISGTSNRTLVVDGRITDQEGPYQVRLSRSKLIGLDTLFTEPGAIVMMQEEQGPSALLREIRPGVYQTNPADIRGQVGKKYRLAILLSDESEYQSSWQLLRETPEIDTVWFEPDVKETERRTLFGAQLFLETQGIAGASFFKWEMHETWKYKVPFASDSMYVALGKGAPKPAEDFHETCWKQVRVGDIMISSVGDLASPSISNHPLQFVSSDSARLNIRYTALIEQYVLGAEEFDFWRNMENINENVGELFDKQPFEVTGNVKNLRDEKEAVLGYFSAYAVKSKRIYINRTDFPDKHLPKPAFYTSLTPFVPDPIDYDCKLYYHPPPPGVPPEDWDINLALLQDGNLRLWYKEDYWFTTPVCGDCEFYNGSTDQPLFWKD